MSLLAALFVAATAARVESIRLVTVEARPAVRLGIAGEPGLVAVERSGGTARVSIGATTLGASFAGGHRFTWSPAASEFGRAVAGPLPDRFEVSAEASAIVVRLALPPETSLEVRREARAVVLLFRENGSHDAEPREARTPSRPEPEPPQPVSDATVVSPGQSGEPPVAVLAPAPTGTGPADPITPMATTATATAIPAAPVASSDPRAADVPAASVADLARTLFPGSSPASSEATGSIAELYPRLFPTGVPEARPVETEAPTGTTTSGAELGPFRVRASVDARYVDADTFLDTVPTRDRFLEVAPRVDAEAPLGAGRFGLDYTPVLRAFATYDQINSSSQIAGARLELPVGAAVTVTASDHFVGGTLDTRIVDPGGEYFYGLGRFVRNDVLAGARVALGPRLGLELSGAAGRVRFHERSTFFDYDSRTASAGLGFELTPNLKASAAYVYDEIPRPPGRPEAQAQAHSARLSLGGDLLPLLSGELAFGYRHQSNPAAGAGGRSYSGLTASGTLNRRLGRDSLVSLFLTRQTSASAYEANGFYVVTSAQASAELPLPLALRLRGGAGYQWNDYRTAATEIGGPRHDRLLGWYLGLRRPLPRRLVLSGTYRVENRYSNVDRFDTDSSGFLLQLEWDALGARE
jgi:hypothetical protein